MSEYVCVKCGHKIIPYDPFSKSTEFNADDYAVLVSHPAPFRKFSKPFLCLIGISRYYTLDEDTYPTFLRDDGTEMDLFAFIQVAIPTKVKVREWECAEREAMLLDSKVGRVVLLLSVAPARAESELEACVEKLFNEGGSADQVDSVVGGGQEAKVGIATGVRIVTKENGDYGASSEAVISGKSSSALRELLASSLLNVEVGVTAMPTLPMVTSLVSATPEHESGAPADSITGLNVRTIGSSKRFVIFSDSSHHSSTRASEAEGDSIIGSDVVPPVMTEAVVTSHAVDIPLVLEMGVKVTSPVRASLFQDSDSTKTVKADTAGPFYFARQDLLMGSRELNYETLHQVFVSQCNILNDSLLDDYDVSREFVDHLAPSALFSQIRKMDYHHCSQSLIERKRLESECEKQDDLLNVRDAKIESLKARLLLKETEVAEAIHLRARVSASEVTEKRHASKIDALKQKNVSERWSYESGGQVRCRSWEMACHLEEKLYPHLLTTISGQRWLLTHGLKLVLVKCLNSSEYLTALEVAISRSIEKGMQDGLAAGIDHGREGRSRTDVSHKDVSVKDIMNLLHLEDPFVDAPGMGDLQPDIEANIAAERSALLDVWTPLYEPLSIQNMIGEASTFASVTTTTLSTTFASASSIPPITVDDYEIMHTDSQQSPQGNVQGDAATVEFEKEDLDTTPERDLLS
uniref:Transposase (Putative), gypsy type n=1 Tax=Tanacetum cinerariifolium TaxID=118510 RepID=A0A6L2JBP1_TANCI|nr:transposase (putative), gypsy type [Tanacetum cinerariifolium]